jgi:hypothetical protein
MRYFTSSALSLIATLSLVSQCLAGPLVQSDGSYALFPKQGWMVHALCDVILPSPCGWCVTLT